MDLQLGRPPAPEAGVEGAEGGGGGGVGRAWGVYCYVFANIPPASTTVASTAKPVTVT